jgi:uncharacterized RDD family membrane protein YckC
MNYLNPEKNLLADDYKVPMEYASTGQRFLNFIIDVVLYHLFLVAIIFLIFLLEAEDELAYFLELFESDYIELFLILFYGIYMGLVEGLMKGKTPGKWITHTKAVFEDGTAINFNTGILRGMCRIVPFELVSIFGAQPWHDKWTKTRVIKIRQ